MAVPIVTFHSGGSDTAASGAGPATALFGTGASSTSATALVNLSADAPTLTGVDVTGLAVLWVDSSSGRQFSKITAVDNVTKIVTCESTYANTESGKNWGIGGKRASLDNADSRTLFGTTGWLPGWVAEIEDAQSLAGGVLTIATIGDTTTGNVILRAATPHVTITQTTSAAVITVTAGTAGGITIQGLKFQNSGATKTAADGINFSGATHTMHVDNCIIGDVTNTLQIGIERTLNGPVLLLTDSIVTHCAGDGIDLNLSPFTILGSVIRNNGGNGIDATMAGAPCNISHSLIYDNGANGVNIAGATAGAQLTIMGNTIHSNTTDGLSITTTTTARGLTVVNNNITANGAWGIDTPSGAQALKGLVDYNNFGTGALANTSGSMNNLTAVGNDLAVDPGYANAASHNFACGTAVKALGFPDSARTVGANQTSTTTFVDIGGAQREEAAAGGGAVYHGAMAGGLAA